MSIKKLLRLLMLMTFSGCMIYMSGCVNTSGQVKIKLPPRPSLEEFNDRELQQIPMTAHEKILVYVNEVEGYAEKVEALPCVQK